MSAEPRNGVDYLVDYYQVLGVERDASLEEITAAWRNKLRLYHSDKYQHLAPEFAQKAEERTRIFNEAYEVLRNSNLRGMFDKKLAGWPEGTISADGTPIMSLALTGFGVSHMLSNPTELEDTLAKMEAYAAAMTGYNPVAHEALERVYEASDGPSDDLETAYSQALLRKDRYLNILASFYREAIGLDKSLELSPPIDYTAHVAGMLNAGKEEVTAEVTRTIHALYAGEMRVLTSGREPTVLMTDALADPETALAKYTEQALAYFDVAASKIMELAQQREDTIAKRMELLRGTYPFNQETYQQRILLHLRRGEKEAWTGYSLMKGEGEKWSVIAWSDDVLESFSDPNQARLLIDMGFNIIQLEIDEEGINPQEAANEVLNKHIALLGQDTSD